MNAGVMMRLVRDRSLIFADLGDLRVLIASSALLSDRAVEGLATAAFAVGLGAAFTGKDVRDSAGCGSTPGKMEATRADTVTSQGQINGVGMIIPQPVII